MSLGSSKVRLEVTANLIALDRMCPSRPSSNSRCVFPPLPSLSKFGPCHPARCRPSSGSQRFCSLPPGFSACSPRHLASPSRSVGWASCRACAVFFPRHAPAGARRRGLPPLLFWTPGRRCCPRGRRPGCARRGPSPSWRKFFRRRDWPRSSRLSSGWSRAALPLRAFLVCVKRDSSSPLPFFSFSFPAALV